MINYKIIGFDPAIKNFGFSCIEIREDWPAWRILEANLLKFPINEIGEELIPSIDLYMMEINRIFRMHKPKDIMIERFQNRSRIGASQNEKVNIMIGLLVHAANNSYKCSVYAKTAAAWKNKINMIIDIEDIYKATHELVKRNCKEYNIKNESKNVILGKIPHTVDSTIMALSIGCEQLKIEKKKFINLEIAGKVSKHLMKGYLK